MALKSLSKCASKTEASTRPFVTHNYRSLCAHSSSTHTFLAHAQRTRAEQRNTFRSLGQPFYSRCKDACINDAGTEEEKGSDVRAPAPKISYLLALVYENNTAEKGSVHAHAQNVKELSVI
jgi:hypothetical protein